MSPISGRGMILLLCSVLAAGEASAAARASDARESTSKKATTSASNSGASSQDLEDWLGRLNGRYTITLKLPPKTECTAASAAGSGAQKCTTSKGVTYTSAVNCRGIGEGPGLYCTFEDMRKEPADKDADDGSASISNGALSRMLLGIDRVARKISVLGIDSSGYSYAGMEVPKGNTLTFSGRCDLPESNRTNSCVWNLSMRAAPDGRNVVMTRTRSFSRGIPYTYELTRQE
jgi:hypothetical protein